MDEEEIDSTIKYAAMYDEKIMEMFQSMGITFIDCEIGIREKSEPTFDEDVPQ